MINLIKGYFWPTTIIIVASMVVVFAFWPIENSDWAESFRTGVETEEEDADTEDVRSADGEGLTGIAVLLPLVKITLFMGIGVILTVFGNAGARLANRNRRESLHPT